MQEIDLAQFVYLEEPTVLQLTMQSNKGEDKILVNIVVLFSPVKQPQTTTSTVLTRIQTPTNKDDHKHECCKCKEELLKDISELAKAHQTLLQELEQLRNPTV